MRTPVLHSPRAILVLILLVGLHVPAHADTTSENTPPQKTPVVGVDLDFPGGALGDLADLLRKDATGTCRLNLIVDPQFRKLTVPAIHVRNAGAYALSEALDRMLRPQGAAVEALGPGGSGDPVFVLVPVQANEIQESTRAFRSYAIAELLDRYTPEQIAGALRTAWELDPANDPTALLIKFHPETRLLFVAGPDGASVSRPGVRIRRSSSVTKMADEVISNLLRQVNLPKAAGPEAPAVGAQQ
ncbi:MAG: hypothetical protein IAE82_03910 [Opitutaceae bacterium]|nr:hypothetical protein [Opitutaceae bacterium]